MENLKERFNKPDTYAVWSKDDTIRFHSTSGGAFSEFAKVVLKDNGIVVGAQYNEDNLVEHVIIDKINDIEKIRQSKYLSSNMNDSFKEIKQELIKNKLVAFCGSPCQVAGLYSYLGKEYDNLFTIDFICRGMNSPKAFKAWISEIEKKENSKVIRVWFKYKKGGWKSSPKRTRLDFKNGKTKIYSDNNNLYMYGYLTSNLYIRPSCGNCKFKGIPRKSDITLADFWGIEKKLDDDKGTSMILVNSEKGRNFFEKIKKNMYVYERDFDSIFKGNPMFSTSAKVPQEGNAFLEDLDIYSFSENLKRYNGFPPKVSIVNKFIYKIKNKIKRIIGM